MRYETIILINYVFSYCFFLLPQDKELHIGCTSFLLGLQNLTASESSGISKRHLSDICLATAAD